jgi:hypothetical protein
MSESAARASRAPDIEVAPLEDGSILFDAESKKFFMLNSSASLIWDELGSPASPDELATKLQARFPNLELDDARRDVDAALGTLTELGLITRD